MANSLCATTVRVPEDYADIETAIDAAAEGDEVVVAPGEYVIARPLVFADKVIRLRSREGPERTLIRMSETPEDTRRASVLLVEGSLPGTLVQGFTVTGGGGTANSASVGLAGGGVAALGGTASLVDCVISGNRAGVGGGIAILRDCSVRLDGCRVTGNHGAGGGIWVDEGMVEITRTTIAGNSWNGLIVSGGSVRLRECLLLGNHGGRGGALSVVSGNFEAWNCLVAGNSAAALGVGAGTGGGLLVDGAAEAYLWNSTIVQNVAERRGGGIQETGRALSLSLTNCIVWDNTGEDLSIAGLRNVSVSHSDVRVDDGLRFPGRRNLNVDPGFVLPGVFDVSRFRAVRIAGEEVTLPDFIVDPGDYRLRPDSPLIDQGTHVDAPTVDLDGNARPCGPGTDIGAYEHGNCTRPTLRFVRGDADADGSVGLTDAIVTLAHLFQGSPAPCEDAADSDDSGGLGLTDAVYLLIHLFRGGPRPPAPARVCGFDATSDPLDCDSYPSCVDGR